MDGSDPFESTFLYAGTYSVVETANSSYSTSATCSDGSPADAVVLSAGEIVTCTFTNTLLTGTLTLAKSVDNLGESGTGYLGPNDFGLTVDGTATTSGTPVTVTAGDHTIAEVAQTGYTAGTWSCTDGTIGTAGEVSAIVNVSGGENVTCTMTNTLIAAPALSITKTATEADYDAVGDVLHYTIVATNIGNVTLPTVTVTDPLVTGLSCTPANGSSLAPGTSMTCTATHIVTQGDIEAGHWANQACVDDGELGAPGVCDREDVPADKKPHLAITKEAAEASYNSVGDTLNYMITATNDGNVTLAAVTVTDPLVSGLTCTPANGSPLAPGAVMTCTATHTVTQADLDAGHWANNACVDDGDLGAPEVCDDEDVPGIADPRLSITKDAAEADYDAVGDNLNYTIVATNTGNVTLPVVTVTDPLVSELSCTPTNGSALAPGAVMTCTATHTVTQADLDAGHWANQACVDDGDLGAAQVCADEDVPGITDPRLSITKVATEAEYDAVGDVLHYTITAKNTGNVTLPAVTVTDPLVSGLTCNPINGSSLAPGAVMTCTVTHTVTQGDIDAGHWANQACVDDGPEGATQACDGEDVPADKKPSLTITKVAAEADYDAVGDTLNYTITAKNTGNVTLPAVTVTDPLVSGLSCTPTNGSALAPGASMECMATHTVTQADLDAGNWANTACVDDGALGAPEVCDGADVPANQTKAINVEKSSTTTTITLAGQVVPYTFVVTNAGNVTLTGITVSDPMCDAAPLYVSGDENDDDKLQVTETWTYTCSHTVTQAEMDTATGQDPQLHNTVTADSNESGPDTDVYDIPITYNPAISVEKSSTTASITDAGQVVTYSFVVTNAGNVTLTGITVSDPMCDEAPVFVSGDTNSDSKLQVTETWTFTCSYTVTQAEMDAGGKLSNTVTADSNESGPDTDTYDIPISQTPVIQVVKTSTTTEVDHAGQVVPYSFVVTNVGNVTLTVLTVTDPMCGATLAYVSGDDNSDSKLQLAESWIYTCSHTVTQAEMDTATGQDPQLHNMVTADSNESEPATDDLDIPITYNPALTVEKYVSIDGGETWVNADETPGPYLLSGIDPQFKFVVTNTGNVTLTGVTVEDSDFDVPDDCITSPLAVGASDDCIVTGTWAAGQHVDTANADSYETLPVYDDAHYFGASPVIDVEKYVSIDGGRTWVDADTATGPYLNAGTAPQFKFVITNTGNVALSGVTVIDSDFPLPAGCIVSTLAAGASDDCIVTGTWASGQHTNTATASGSFTDDNDTIAGDSDTDDANYFGASPAIDVEKYVSVDSGTTWIDADTATGPYMLSGEAPLFKFVVTNTGNVPLFNVSLTDTDFNIASQVPNLAVGASQEYIVTGIWAEGQHTNTASISGDYTDGAGNVSSPSDSDDANYFGAAPAMTSTKTGTWIDGDGDGWADAGETITYTFTVRNTGNVNLTNVTITDPMVTVVGGPLASLAVGAEDTTTFTASYVITQADVDAGNVHNVALVTGTPPVGPPIENEPPEDTPLPKNPALTLDKSGTFGAGANNLADAGEVITYTFVVTNTGNVTLHNVVVTDPLAGLSVITCDATTIPVGGFVTCTATYGVTQADIDAGFVYNMATADSDESGPVTDDNNETLPQNKSMAVAKTSTTALVTAAGQVVSYSFAVSNTGNVTLTSITVTDDMCDAAPVYQSGDNDQDNALDLTEIWLYTCSHTVTQVEMDAASGEDPMLSNIVWADSTQTNPVSDTLDIPILYNPALTIVKSGAWMDADADGYADAGEVINYTFTVTNTGNVTLTGVTVTDPKVTPISCPADTVAVGGNMTCSATYAVTQTDIDAGSVYNTATADSNESGPDDDDETVSLPQNPHLSVVKTGTWVDGNADGYANPGEAVNYSYEVTNDGNVTLSGLTLTDSLGITVGCPDTTLSVGEVVTCTASYPITQVDIDAGKVDNLVTANAVDPQGDPASDTDTWTEPLPQNPAISIVKSGTFNSGDDTYADPGEVISYSFLVKNEGNVTLTGITVSDPKVSLISCPTTTLAVGTNMTCTATYAVTQSNIDAGSVYNLATADSTQSGPDDDDETVILPQNPALTLDKTGTFDADADGFANVGELISYEFLVTNTGNVTLTGITVTDPKVSSITCPADTLAVGESMTCTATFAVTQGDIDAGSVYNLATADSTQSEPDTDDETVTLPQNPAISIVKATNGMDGGYFLVGSVITWEYEVTNTGNVTLSNITVSDDQGVNITCPADTLAVGESMTCTATGTATAGLYENTGTVTADDPQSDPASDTDESSYFGADPEIDVEKYVSIDGGTTWADADAATGPYLNAAPAPAPQFKFVVTNTGNVALSNVSVTDSDFTLPAGCISSTLAVGASDDCIITGVWAAGQHNNKATASGSFTDNDDATETDTDTDEANYFGADPQISIVKTTADAYGNEGDSIGILPGETVTWKYLVTNKGNVALSGVGVTDDQGVTVTCPKTTLAVDESMTCTATGIALAGWYNNIGTASGSFTDGGGHTRADTASDPSSYYGLTPGGVTNSQLCDFGEQFRLIFTPDMQRYTSSTPYYKLSDSNPGQFFYNLFQTNDGSVETYTLEIPYPFVTQGANPVHVYGGLTVDPYNSGTPSPDNLMNCYMPTKELASYASIITLGSYTDTNDDGKIGFGDVYLVDVPAVMGFQYINIHLDYGLEKTQGWLKKGANVTGDGTVNPAIAGISILDHTTHTFQAYADGVLIGGTTDTIYNLNEFKQIKGFGGLVYKQTGEDVEGNPIYAPFEGAQVELMKVGSTTTIEMMTTDADGWYLSNYIHKGKATTYTLTLVETVEYPAQSVTDIQVGGNVKYGEGIFYIP